MALRYFNPEDCDKHGDKYSSFSCMDSPAGGKECVGQGSGGQFTDCKQCLNECDPSPPSTNPSPDNNNPKPVQQHFLSTTVGKVSISIAVAFFLLLIIVLVYKRRRYI